ncbi:MAG: hypothetical protein FJY77_03090 [Candidatus Altiarchaeales archaeon]|nr:hypothetical protein [Candidatus Altiarchaeales archaeon]
MAFEAVVRKWGNSFGIIFPKDVMKRSHINTNEKVLIDVVKEANFQKTFGTLKAKTGAQEFKDLVRQGWN